MTWQNDVNKTCRRVGRDLPTIDLGSRRELFVDDYLIDRMDGVRLALQQPRDEGTVFWFDRPWEGRWAGYFTVIKDGDTFRLYYRGKPTPQNAGVPDEITCYAESSDGIEWERPSLGIVDIKGSTDNNAIIGPESPDVRHNFTPFLDTRPGIDPSERFKALGGLFDHDRRDATTHGLLLYGSADGIHWKQLHNEPVIDQSHRGPLLTDTSSIPTFWSEAEERYVCYLRDWIGDLKRPGSAGTIRWIGRTTSPDLIEWEPVVKMQYEPAEHLYTSNVQPYFRAPHIYIALPARFMLGRQVVTPEEAKAADVHPDYIHDCSETVFMTSRGGQTFDRTFREGFVRPGIGAKHWISRTNYAAIGVVQTGDAEMSLYIQQESSQPTNQLRRYSLRLDGFASAKAPYAGGELLTKPFTFSGNRLFLNFATGAAGDIRVEVQGANSEPLSGYSLEDSRELVGNYIEREVSWRVGPDLSKLVGQTVRLRFAMKDADLYAFRFRDQ